MIPAISPLVAGIHPPPIAEVKSWLADRPAAGARPLLDLCQAVPDFAPPPELLAHLKDCLDDPATCRYSPDEGLPAVRSSVAEWYRRRYGAGPTAGEICLTVGASQAFWLAMLVLCRAGDEVVVPLPAYFDHPMGLTALGLRPVYVPFIEDSGGRPAIERIAAAITPRTRAILLVTPSNPTGAMLTPEEIDALFALARARGVVLVLDETYNAFVPGMAPPHRLFARPEWSDHFVHIASFGKTFALTGFRAGALIASARMIDQALKVQDSMVVCAPRLTQLAIAYGCERLDPWVAANNDAMQQRYQVFRRAFAVAENPFRMVAGGGFFAWVKHPLVGRTGREAARRLALEHDLICLPGEVFGPGLTGYLRLAFGNISAELIPAAVERFCAFTLRQEES